MMRDEIEEQLLNDREERRMEYRDVDAEIEEFLLNQAEEARHGL